MVWYSSVDRSPVHCKDFTWLTCLWNAGGNHSTQRNTHEQVLPHCTPDKLYIDLNTLYLFLHRELLNGPVTWPRSVCLFLEASCVQNQRWSCSFGSAGKSGSVLFKKPEHRTRLEGVREAWNPNVTVPVTVSRPGPPVISALPRLMARLTGWVPIT